MQIVALLTDYGLTDYYVAQLKGEVYSACPSVNIIDISHNVPPYNINAGAWMLKNTFRSFPSETIFMALIAEQHYSYQRLLACKYSGYYFLIPDNGIITMILDHNPPEMMVAIDTNIISSPTNIGQFMRALKEISYNRNMSSLGNAVTNYKKLIPQTPFMGENSITGAVMFIDYFGNAITNIHISEFNKFNYAQLKIHYRRREQISRLVKYYSEVQEGDDLARFNDAGYLEICMRGDHAAQRMGIKVSDSVIIEFLGGF